jgi:uncharacterized SAM-binding protein YcdF (DUF218 family)
LDDTFAKVLPVLAPGSIFLTIRSYDALEKSIFMLKRNFARLKRLLILLGIIFAGILVLPVTHVPWRWFVSMAEPGMPGAERPEVLVMMGGGGIPSETGLTRSYKTAEAARLFPGATVIIAMPYDPGLSFPDLLDQELLMRGVAAGRLRREPHGRNTREQALEVYKLIGENPEVVVGLVTSPEHMKRVWVSFEKAGFRRLIAYPSWAEAIRADLDYSEADLGGKSLGGAVGGSDIIKYKYWDNLMILVKCARETVALWYYRLMGWA